MTKPIKPDLPSVKASLTRLWSGSGAEIERVWTEVLEEMLTLFYPPFRASTDEELADQACTALRAYLDDLAEFDHATLHRAWREVRRHHKTERWPIIATIRAACLETLPARTSTATPNRKYEPHPIWAELKRRRDIAIEHHRAVEAGPLGQQARAEGWELALHHFLHRQAIMAGAAPKPADKEWTIEELDAPLEPYIPHLPSAEQIATWQAQGAALQAMRLHKSPIAPRYTRPVAPLDEATMEAMAKLRAEVPALQTATAPAT